jgi:hypothetical protein
MKIKNEFEEKKDLIELDLNFAILEKEKDKKLLNFLEIKELPRLELF